jgi:hypothetical protein
MNNLLSGANPGEYGAMRSSNVRDFVALIPTGSADIRTIVKAFQKAQCWWF